MQEPLINDAEPRTGPVPQQPTEVVESGGIRYTLLGTAHVSQSSADEVERLVTMGDFDAVAIELDADRHAAIVDPDRWKKLDLFQIFKQGKAGAVMASLALGAFQQRLADQMGIQPGQEMRVAIEAAERQGLPLLLVDRDIGVTLRRVYRNIPWWRRALLMTGLFTSIFSNEKIEAEEIERLKEGDILEATFTEFAETSQELYEPLIAERDRYMALKLRQAGSVGQAARPPAPGEPSGGNGIPGEAVRAPSGGTATETVNAASAAAGPTARQTGNDQLRNVLVVIGAGHLKGVMNHLEKDQATGPVEIETELAGLESLPPPSVWPKIISWAIIALILAGFVVGFMRSPELGFALLSDWFVITGALAALGAIVALAHPLTIVGSLVAAPFTTLHPLLGAGMVAAALELWLRKPTVSDFESLRQDVTRIRGWWQNRVARTFLVFLFVSLGAAAGFYIAGSNLLIQLTS